ncbi:MAG: 2-C-methyl-D-erythritol 4-phosphate cytidylyltransferase [Bacillota bacterium]|nr:2-C-methyl-D-erythritol 4-phosphate cytidylyltransferase [Bacillota bacterium]
MKVSVIIAAAGSGTRMGGVRKPYLLLDGMPVLVRSLKLFLGHPNVVEIIAVIRPGEEGEAAALLKPYREMESIKLVPGGATRQESVWEGLRALSEQCDLICIHDAARPLASEVLLEVLLDTAAHRGAAVPVLPVTDTVKEIDSEEKIVATPERERLRLVQTPQVFRRELILEAYKEAGPALLTATDDSSLVERIGGDVYTVPGEDTNIKLTSPLDLKMAAWLVKGALNR